MSTTRPPPNYYAILEVSETASAQQIRDAYKRAALKTHPDRVSANSPDRPARTRRFQLVNDAYYTLSDPSRRSEYDAQRKLYGQGSGRRRPPSSTYADPFDEADEAVPPGAGAGGAQPGFYSWAWNYFMGGNNAGNNEQQQRARQENENQQFGDVFEEMLREEGMDGGQDQPSKTNFWSIAGGAAGGVLGFIAANVPGAVAGMVAGNRFGAIRDAKGKSVYAVFQELPQDDRARLLAQLATRVFSHAVGI
ncbi:DnaJ-domain-containing protein [Biscogniauxia mediterranea]|nr:DnaJ-domain-containing protein [Biscogniauxia mediterranea]